MDQKIPFTSYDFWAYLSSGFLLLFGLDQALHTNLLTRNSWTIPEGVIAFSCAYAVGHVVASLSSYIFEKFLVGKIFGYPRDILLGLRVGNRWTRAVLPGYYQALPDSVIQTLRSKGPQLAIPATGEQIFWPAFVNARASSTVAPRLDNFLNLYGFCRNIALVAFIDSALFYWSYLQSSGTHLHLTWARVALIAGLGLLIRYFKFYRLYCVEVFTSFAYSR